MVEVIATDEFAGWFMDLSQLDAKSVARVVGLLEVKGPTLGYPYSSAIRGSSHPLRELRVQSGARPLRVFYAFDVKRQAVLLLGGDKTGDDRFYKKNVPRAEAIWEAYIEEIGDQDKER